mmetsp:Transcript_14714/g.27562  ORF Transcript_14714/g.27562 Transcript_14714/m.27562 type:complete len:564 (+) Transcript_14714:105-1796(+)
MADDEEDPFAVVIKPAEENKKMSTYLKKHRKDSSSHNHLCVEESSHGTTSTRSTTASNRTTDDKSSNSNNKNNNFSAFESSAEDDTFGNFGGGGGNGESDGNVGIAFSSDFGNGLEFGQGGAFGGGEDFGGADDGAAAFSSDPFGTSGGDFNASFEDEPIKFGEGDFGSKAFADDHDQTSKSPRKVEPMSIRQKREQWKQNARSNSHSTGRRGGRPPPQRTAPRRHHSTDTFDLNMSGEIEESSTPPKPQSRRRLAADHATSAGGDKERERGAPPRTRSMRSRRASIATGSSHASSHDDPPAEMESSEPAKPTRARRRSSLGYTHSDGSMEPVTTNPPSSSRTLGRGPPAQRGPPQRHKSSAGTAMDPRMGSRRIRTRRTGALDGGSSSNLGELFNESSVPPAPEEESTTPGGTKDKKWAKDRSRNQEMIMNMYKDGGTSKKTGQSNPSASSSDLGSSMDALDIHDDIVSPAISGGSSEDKKRERRSTLTKFKMHKKKDLQAPEEEGGSAAVDARNLAGRSRGTLLERVGAVEEHSDRPTSSLGKGGSSYSDRILSSQSRKRG